VSDRPRALAARDRQRVSVRLRQVVGPNGRDALAHDGCNWLIGAVHTREHGSWLDLVDAAFSNRVRTPERRIRVASGDERKHRILKGIDEMNAHPGQLQWKHFDFHMT
jgi:hypothetical protein